MRRKIRRSPTRCSSSRRPKAPNPWTHRVSPESKLRGQSGIPPDRPPREHNFATTNPRLQISNTDSYWQVANNSLTLSSWKIPIARLTNERTARLTHTWFGLDSKVSIVSRPFRPDVSIVTCRQIRKRRHRELSQPGRARHGDDRRLRTPKRRNG